MKSLVKITSLAIALGLLVLLAGCGHHHWGPHGHGCGSHQTHSHDCGHDHH